MTLDEAEKIASATKNWGFKESEGQDLAVFITDGWFSPDQLEAIAICVRAATQRRPPSP